MNVSRAMLPERHVSLHAREWSGVAAVALRGQATESSVVAEVMQARLDPARAVVKAGASDVRIWLAYESVDDWQSFILNLHSEVSAQFGVVSIGHVLRKGAAARDATYAIFLAVEALVTGERLFGAGHLTSYAEALLATYLLNGNERELHTLYEGTVGKLVPEKTARDAHLVRTLDVYLRSITIAKTAQNLGVHRNTVLYRLKRIEDITAADLEDGSTRLMFQIGLLAGRVLRQAQGSPRSAA